MQRVPGYESDRSVLAIYDRAAGTSRVASETLDAWVNAFRFAPDGKRIFFTADVKGRTPLHALDLATGKISVVSNVGLVDAFEVSPDGTWAVVARRQMHRPTELHRVALSGPGIGAESPLTRQNQALLDEVDFRPMEEVFVDSPSGKKIQVLLVKPHGFDPARKYPAIVNVHGGPQSQWADAFRGDAQVYPGAGYVVAFPNPHGSTGWGQDFTAAISKDWDGRVIQDVTGRDRLARRAALGRQGPHGRDGLVVGRLRDDVARGPYRPLQGHRLDDGRLRPAVDVLLDGGALVPRVGPRGNPVAEPGGLPEAEPVVLRHAVQDADAGRHRPEGLPRALHPVALLLHRPAEEGRPLAPGGVRGLRALARVVRHGPVLRRPPRLVPHYLGGEPSPWDPKALAGNAVFGGKDEKAKP